MAPCNCGKKASVSYTYIHVSSVGKQTSYRTEIEARAAVIREGGSYRVEEKK